MGNNITQERAARRFHQLAVLERQVMITNDDILRTQDRLKALRKHFDGLLDRLHAAARDEGELPLFDLEGEDA